MSRIQLANYFKQQAFDAIGVNPQRLGAPMGNETATGSCKCNESIICTNRNLFQSTLRSVNAKSASNENGPSSVSIIVIIQVLD